MFGPAGTTDAVDVSFRVDGGQAGHVAFETTITSQTTGQCACFWILRRGFGASRRDDDGAVMAIVLGLILVGALISVLVVSSVIAALGNTTATRASVQAQAASTA